jgi:transcription antitermination factor NusG
MATEEKAVWEVAHTRPRCEKKLATYCQRHSLHHDLPCYDSVHKYRGKQVTFQKPLFPGYLFIQAATSSRRLLLQSDYIANLLTVTDQEQFARQLEEIQEALDSGLDALERPGLDEHVAALANGRSQLDIEATVERLMDFLQLPGKLLLVSYSKKVGDIIALQQQATAGCGGLNKQITGKQGFLERDLFASIFVD